MQVSKEAFRNAPENGVSINESDEFNRC